MQLISHFSSLILYHVINIKTLTWPSIELKLCKWKYPNDTRRIKKNLVVRAQGGKPQKGHQLGPTRRPSNLSPYRSNMPASHHGVCVPTSPFPFRIPEPCVQRRTSPPVAAFPQSPAPLGPYRPQPSSPVPFLPVAAAPSSAPLYKEKVPRVPGCVCNFVYSDKWITETLQCQIHPCREDVTSVICKL